MNSRVIAFRASYAKALSTPALAFYTFSFAHLLFWTIVPTLVSPNAPLDVIEGYVWGHEWLLGTYKHPPMQAWWLETLTHLTNNAPWTHFLASQIAIVIGFWAIWQTGRRILSENLAILSVFLMEGIVYYNFTSPEFNPNVLQLAFWPLIGLYFHRSAKDNQLLDWLLLGFWSACGLYSKYSTLLLLFVLIGLMVAHPFCRKHLKTKGPYIALLTCFVFLLPHINWLIKNNFIPFDYMQSRMHETNSTSEFFARPFRFTLSQALCVFPLFVLLASLGVRPSNKFTKNIIGRSFDRTFLICMVFGPFTMLLIAAWCGIRLHDMWGTPLWGYVSLALLERFPPVALRHTLRRFAFVWMAVFIFELGIYAIAMEAYPYLTNKSLRVYFPGKQLSKDIINAWKHRYPEPLQYVIGDTWVAGNIAYYPPGRQHVLIDGNYKISPWIKQEDIKQHGGILVWCIENCACNNMAAETPAYVKDFPLAEFQAPLILNRQTNANVPPVKIGWAILPPSKNEFGHH